jgi:hypothetical protein
MMAGTNYFCTYCDQGYVARLLCLHDSLLAQREPFRLFVLCFDDVTARVVADAGDPDLIGISLSDFLNAQPEYAAVRPSRTKVEFYFTATPVLVRHCFGLVPDAGQMTYLDSDLYFFGPASAVFAEQGEASIGIVPHRFPARLAHLQKWGAYNVAWVSFRRDRDGLACLKWWRARCLEWCHDHIDHDRFADQGYLTEFPKRFANVRVLDHPGINAAPWNMDGVRLVARDAEMLVNDRRLLFYHFQGIREISPGWFDVGLRIYETTFTPALRNMIYLPYLTKLVHFQSRLKARYGIAPLLGFQRLPAGSSIQDRWNRFFARRMLPLYRRVRGQLLYCADPAAD